MERVKARKKILNRYEKNENGTLIIDIAVTKIEDLYDDFDRFAPYRKKDLTPELVEYIVLSLEDIRDLPFLIRFILKTTPTEDKKMRVRASVKNYFEYLEALEVRELFRMRRTSGIHFLIGVFFVILYALVTPKGSGDVPIYLHIITEGLIVAAWVSLWNAIDTFIVNWTPHKRKITLYQNIRCCEIIFEEEND